jgi:hypothetical protein
MFRKEHMTEHGYFYKADDPLPRFRVALRLYLTDPDAFDCIVADEDHPLYQECEYVLQALGRIALQGCEQNIDNFISFLENKGIHDTDAIKLAGQMKRQ